MQRDESSQNDEWVAVSRIAAESGRSEAHIRRLIRSGRVQGRKVVTIWLVSRLSWLEYLHSLYGEKRGPK